MAAEGRDLLITVINWHHEDETGRCLQALQALRQGGTRLILVDNESTADSSAWCEVHQPQVDYLERRVENTGFCGACNIALQVAGEEGFRRILFLNADAGLEAETIPRLMAELDRHPDAAMTSPVLCDEVSREPYFCGLLVKTGESRIDHLSLSDARALGEGPHGLALHGTVLMADVAKLASVGGFDTRFFAYWEDTDLSLRLMAKGYDCRICLSARAYHQSGRSGEADTRRSAYFYYYMARNEVRFWWRHARGLARIKALYWHAARSRTLAQGLGASGHRREAKTVITGLVQGFLGIAGRWRGQPQA